MKCIQNKSFHVKNEAIKGYLNSDFLFTKVSSDCFGPFEYIRNGNLQDAFWLYLVIFSADTQSFDILKQIKAPK